MKRPRSDHFNGKKFFYPGAPRQRGFLDVLRWKLTSRPTPWPATPPSEFVCASPLPLPPAPQGSAVSATWIGHATFLIRSAAGNFLTDPVFSNHIGPTARIGTKRAVPAAFGPEVLPPLRAVLLSHDHYDHCDLPSLRRVAEASPPENLITPLGYAGLLRDRGSGVPAAYSPPPAGPGRPLTLIEIDWWENHRLPPLSPGAPAASVTLVPARHWCRRSLGGTNARLWGGYVLRLPGRSIYFAGDTAFDAALFTAIRQRCGSPDLALLPIGAYEPRWFMRDSHMNPEEAVKAHQLLGARHSIAMHWGAFQLTDEGYDAPPRALASARAAAGLSEDAFRVLAVGATIEC